MQHYLFLFMYIAATKAILFFVNKIFLRVFSYNFLVDSRIHLMDSRIIILKKNVFDFLWLFVCITCGIDIINSSIEISLCHLALTISINCFSSMKFSPPLLLIWRLYTNFYIIYDLLLKQTAFSNNAKLLSPRTIV